MSIIKPLVTVIIPSYNHAQYILTAINSVKNQTYDNWELIIIDDGSTDNTHEILEKMPKDDRIVLFLNKDNKRQSYRMNQALNSAKGEYISILYSDDWYLPQKLEKQIFLFSKLPDDYGVVYSAGYRYFEDNNETIEVETNKHMKRGWIFKELLLEPFFVYPISPLVKKICFLDYPFNEKYMAEGEAIFFKIALKYKFDYVDEPLVTMRNHTYNIGSNTETMLRESTANIIDLFNLNEFPTDLKQHLNGILAKNHREKGLEFIKLKAEPLKARKTLIKAIKFRFNYIFDCKVLIGLLMSFLPKKFLLLLSKVI